MTLRQEQINGQLAMTVVNTLKQVTVEVPNSAGAKKVICTSYELEVDNCDMVNDNRIYATISKGKRTVSTASLQQEGAFGSARGLVLYSAGVYHNFFFEAQDHNRINVEIAKDGDGKFYVTLSVNTTANGAGVMGLVNYFALFIVEV